MELHIEAPGAPRPSRARVRKAALIQERKTRLPRPFPRARDWQNAARRVARDSDPGGLADLLAAIAHPQRITILLELLGGEATHKLLARTTGLKAGPLYHHLRELRGAGLIGPRVRDLYVITARGRWAVLAALAMEKACR